MDKEKLQLSEDVHDLIHALDTIRKLALDEAKIRQKKRRLFSIACKIVDTIIKEKEL